MFKFIQFRTRDLARDTTMLSLRSGSCATTSPLLETEYHELGGLHRRQANLDDELPLIAHLRRIELRVALDVEGFRCSPAKECPVAPHRRQEGLDVPPDARPQILVVRLEYDPLRATLDRLLHVVEQTTYVDVTPRRIAAQRASPPNADSEVREAADAVDANGIEEVLLPFRDLHFRLQSAPNDLIGRRLVDTALVVAPGINAGDVAGRWNRKRTAVRTGDPDPRVIERREFRIEIGFTLTPPFYLLRCEIRRRIEDGDPVAHLVAVIDHGQLDRFHGILV